MSKQGRSSANYGNWVSTRIILAPAALALICALLSILWVYLLIPAGIFFLSAAYFTYARYLFSPAGRNIQNRIRKLVIDNLDWDGKGSALDIGCGSGAMAIDIAKGNPSATIMATDYWGGNWEYSQKTCQENAQEENVGERVRFQRASASGLPFDDGQFDAVVSNLVFHEVKDSANKMSLIKEALRVLKKGGKFSLQDLFHLERMYGKPEDILATVRNWGVEKVEFVDTKNSSFIPGALRLPFMVGTLGLIKGVK